MVISDNNRSSGEDSLRSIATAAQEVFNADLCLIASVDPIIGKVSLPLFASAHVEMMMDQAHLIEIGNRTLEGNERCSAILAEKSDEGKIPAGLKGVKALFVIPLRTAFDNKPVALIWLGFELPRSFTGEDEEHLDSFQDRFVPFLRDLWRLEILAKEELTKEANLMIEMGRSAKEIAHRLINELGLVRTYVDDIREVLAAHGIENADIEDNLKMVVIDVSHVLNACQGFRTAATELLEERTSDQIVTITMHQLLEDTRHALAPLPANVTLVWETSATPGILRVIPQQISRILSHLVVNAIEAMPNGGTIFVQAHSSRSDVWVSVSDTGPGIPIENQSKVFSPYFSTKTSSGLGLWSARHYARANGGELICEERPDIGAKFILSLPVTEGGSA
jgi:signal transduction histidine kinase